MAAAIAPSEEVLNISTLAAPALCITPTLSARLGTPRKVPSGGPTSARRKPHMQEAALTKQEKDREYLISAKQVDEMIQAIHTPRRDYARRLEQAYKDLSRGMHLPGADVPCLASQTTGLQPASATSKGDASSTSAAGSASSPRRKNRSMPKEKGTQSKTFPSTALSTPWGPERANIDQPTRDHVLHKRQNYCRLLDQQREDDKTLSQHHQRQKRQQDDMTSTSLETRYHTWGGTVDHSGATERVIHKELLATVGFRQRCDREQKEAERQDAVRHAEESEKQMAFHWHIRQAEEKQEKERLAATWKEAASDRKRLEEAQKAAALLEEKEKIQRTNQGLVPARRLRRPAAECKSAQEAISPRPRRPAQLVLSPITGLGASSAPAETSS